MNIPFVKNADTSRLYTVYHIRPKGKTDTGSYYVGITKNALSFRLSQHATSKRPVGEHIRTVGLDNVEIVALAQLPLADALAMEHKLRPDLNMGWNVMAGGAVAKSVCITCGCPTPKLGTGKQCHRCRPKVPRVAHNLGTSVRCTLVDPQGAVHYPASLTQFCREHGLVPANVRKVLNGLRPHTKGWRGYIIG